MFMQLSLPLEIEHTEVAGTIFEKNQSLQISPNLIPISLKNSQNVPR